MTTLIINNQHHDVDAPTDMPLLWVLRDTLGLTGTKFGCGIAQCGACTVHVDGQAVRSCVTPIGAIGTAKITTIEGIGETATGKLVQKAWLDLDVVQCGYCQSGQIMSATALLKEPCGQDDAAVRECMSGNICRCGAYNNIVAAVQSVRRGTQ